MPVCLICRTETKSTHLGMDACRACTVFFRRHRGARESLKCVNGTGKCTDYRKASKASKICRKCRLDRFAAVMDAGRKDDTDGTPEPQAAPSLPSSSSEDSRVEMPDSPSVVIDKQEMHAHSKISHHTILERMRVSYRSLCIMRRTAEFQLRGISINPFEADKEEYELDPCTYHTMNEGFRILVKGLFHFVSAVFPEFASLSTDDKWMLIRNYQKIFHFIDSCHRMQKRYGENIRACYCFGSYTTTLSLETVDEYFSDCVNQKNVKEAARTLRNCMPDHCSKMKVHVSRLQPTEEEYLALMGIAFWTVENDDDNEELTELSTRYRTEILSDLASRYRATIGEEEGTIRIGGLYGLLMGIKRAEMNMKWEFEVYRMLNVFDDNTYMYKLQTHKPDLD